MLTQGAATTANVFPDGRWTKTRCFFFLACFTPCLFPPPLHPVVTRQCQEENKGISRNNKSVARRRSGDQNSFRHLTWQKNMREIIRFSYMIVFLLRGCVDLITFDLLRWLCPYMRAIMLQV